MKDELAIMARAMRNVPTEPELRLWQRLRASQLGGHKFRRQAVLAPWVADFFCPAKGLIVELDGDTHDPARDARRDVALLKLGYRTIRFMNADVMRNIDGVLETILSTLEAAPDRWRRPHPNPSPEGEGLSLASGPSSSEEGLGW